MYAKSEENGKLDLREAERFKIDGQTYVLIKFKELCDSYHHTDFLTPDGDHVRCANIFDYTDTGACRWFASCPDKYGGEPNDRAAVRYFKLRAANPEFDFAHLLEEKLLYADLSDEAQLAFECARSGEAVTIASQKGSTQLQRDIESGMYELQNMGLVTFQGSANTSKLFKLTSKGWEMKVKGEARKF